ncbi:MAG: flavodoxin domain-containing protein [Actinomycetota bacterium]
MSMTSAPFIPENAPFNNEQRAWLNGLMAGLFSPGSSASSPGAPAAAAPATVPVTILFGSQTGNSETLARKIAKLAKKQNLSPSVTDLAEYSPENIASEERVLLITSTYGDGEPPDSAKAFHTFLRSESAPSLENLAFTVLGLGDSSYPDFNQCAIDFDERFAELGARRLSERVLCDVDFEKPAEVWQKSVFKALSAMTPEPTKDSGVSVPAVAGADPDEGGEPEEARKAAPAFDKKHPYPARLLCNRNLNRKGSGKENRHIEISLGQSGLTHEAGDALGVYPSNSPRLVDKIIAASGLPEDAPTPLPDGSIAPLFEALRFHYDINRLASPFVETCARLSKAELFQKLIADKELMKTYIDGRNILDPITEEKVVFDSTEWLIAPLKKLQPRVYSIASSPLAHEGEVHLTVGTVRWEAHGGARLGVCSNYLAGLSPDEHCRVFVHSNKTFRPPSDAGARMIMVGPGTGIAPFRAFIEERAARGHTGENWLFFGDRKSACDFLYEDELAFWQKKGVLTRLDTAFSRDQPEKIYVQDRMHENGKEFYDWLESGASFYVCGDASRMAKDVDTALHEIIAEHSKKGLEYATDYVKFLRNTKRYLRDVY